MDIIFENLGFIIFLVFFILPAVKKLKQKKQENGGVQAKKAGGKPAGPSRAMDDDTRVRTSRSKVKKEKSRQLREVLDKAGLSEGLAGLEKALKQGWDEFTGEEPKRPVVGEAVSADTPLKKSDSPASVQEFKTLVAEMGDQAAEAREAALPPEGTAEGAPAPSPVRRYGHQDRISPLTRIGAMSPLKQAVVWKEILDPPRGLS